MAGNANQKLKLLYLKEFFERETDEEHGVTIAEIQTHLARNGIDSERKSIYADITWLRRFGMDILMKKGKQTTYALVNKQFELPELLLLADAVSSSRFITRKKSVELIKKLSTLASAYEARSLNRQVYVDQRIKTMNESIYYNVDAIHRAIAASSKLEFRYFSYSFRHERVMRHEGEPYVVSPLALLYSEENYYLTAFSDQPRRIANYRVDRMVDVTVTDMPREHNEATARFDPVAYLNTQFSMYGGEKESVEILFHNSLATVVIDRFGGEISLIPRDAEHFSIRIDLEISPTFFSWICLFGSKAYITAPGKVVRQFSAYIRDIVDSYPTFD